MFGFLLRVDLHFCFEFLVPIYANILECYRLVHSRMVQFWWLFHFRHEQSLKIMVPSLIVSETT